jgi:hypothetical protein
MPHTKRKRYAVVSCHVERPLDDEVWARFSSFQRRRPGGFAIAAVMRPPDTASGEDESVWLARAQEAASHAPLGHHTHWTSPEHARPTPADTGGAGERVLAEGLRLRELGLAPTHFCGGAWYTDVGVAEACAGLGYVDCTPRARRPPYLAPGERWASLAEPARVRLPSGALLRSLPTTHSIRDLARELIRPAALPPYVHVYFHDTDLLAYRRHLLGAVLPVLAVRTQVTDLDALGAEALASAPDVAWAEVAQT